MHLKSTATAKAAGVKTLVYGESGSGKTSLIPTMPSPVIFSSERGLLSIADSNLPFIDINSIKEFNEAYRWLISSKEAQQFQSVAIDSISDIAEVILKDEKEKSRDGRKAYGEMQDQVLEYLRLFRDLKGKHVLMIAKMEKGTDEMERTVYAPSTPGTKLSQKLPYMFDEVFALRVERGQSGQAQRILLCNSDAIWTVKDRSRKLNQWESPHMGQIIQKITGGRV